MIAPIIDLDTQMGAPVARVYGEPLLELPHDLYIPPEALEIFLAKATIRANTPKTVTSRTELAKLIARAREQGYASVDDQLELGLRSVAVPVRDRSGAIVAAINASTQSARFSVEEMERVFLPHLQRAAARIEDFFVAK